MRPSLLIVCASYGSTTCVTPSACLACANVASTASLFSLSVIFSPSGAAKTMRALAPPAPGNFCSSRSCACWDSVPGTENLLLVWPLNAAALATTRPRTVIHASSTVLRRRKAQPPSRYRYVAISLDSLWLRPGGLLVTPGRFAVAGGDRLGWIPSRDP